MADTLHHRSLRVLVIEDDTEMATFIEKVLGDAGHDVECARDGAAGLARARAEDFDALVVDRMLPEKDGLTLIREFRDAGGTTPALFLSALGDVIAARMARAQAEISHWDGYDYVVINDDVDVCFQKVREILAAERMRRTRQTGLIDFVRELTRG